MAEEPETDNVKFKSEETADDEKKENTPLVMTEEQREACRVMFEKVSLYLNGELTGTCGHQMLITPSSYVLSNNVQYFM